MTARRAAQKAGATTLLIDPGPFGTTCARVGCMPSKLLIAAAESAHQTREGHVFGIDAEPRVDGVRVMKRVRELRDFFVGFVLDSVEDLHQSGQLIKGWGQVQDRHTILVSTNEGEQVQVKANKSIVLATGSTPFVPPRFNKLPPEVLLGNDDVFELEDLPKSILVVGAGVIGLELGQSFSRLGVRTTIVGVGGQVGPLRDPAMTKLAQEIFTEELDAHFDMALPPQVEVVDGGVRVRFTNKQTQEVVDAVYERVLVAAGRRPNLKSIDVKALDIPHDDKGMPEFDTHTMQIANTNMFLAGDVNDDRPLLHEAADEGTIAGGNAATFPEIFAKPRTTPLSVVFSDPQIAIVGAPWSELTCKSHRVGSVDYSRQGRARVMNKNKGAVRIYGKAGTGELLGAEMMGPGVEHTAHLLAWAIQQRMTVTQALSMPFYHPVLEEGIRTALRSLQSQMRLARPVDNPCTEFGPGA